MIKTLWSEDLDKEVRPPLDYYENVMFRDKIIRAASRDDRLRRHLRSLAKSSPFFFINTFGWTIDPRKSQDPVLPFVMWDVQVQLMKGLVTAINDETDFFIEKARDMGATWNVAMLMAWLWLFHPNTSCLAGSYKEERVDKKADSIFFMIDFFLAHLPDWMLPVGYNPSKHRSYMSVKNPEIESMVEGEATSTQFGRGGRRTMILYDEFAFWGYRHSGQDEQAWESTADVTRTRIALSTPYGITNHYYYLRRLYLRGLLPGITMEYWQNPNKMWGAHCLVEDKDNRDRIVHSPWLERETLRRKKDHIEREVLIRYKGGGLTAFPFAIDEIDKQATRIKDNILDGDYGTPYTLDIIKKRGMKAGTVVTGHSKTTIPQQKSDMIARFEDVRSYDGFPDILFIFDEPVPNWSNRYVISSDQSENIRNGDFACIHVFDRGEGDIGDIPRVVATWRGREDAVIVAEIMHYLAKMYGDALLSPEANPIGQAVIMRLRDIYGNTKLKRKMYSTRTTNVNRRYKPGGLEEERLGFICTNKTKPALIEHTSSIIRSNQVDIRCLQTAVELLNYERRPNGSYGASGQNHDDAAMSFMIGLYAALSPQFPSPRPKVGRKKTPELSVNERYARSSRRKDEPSWLSL